NAALGQRLLGSLHRQAGCGGPRGYDVSLPYAGPLDDPFVRGLDHLFQVGVGQQTRRGIGSQGRDFFPNKIRQKNFLQIDRYERIIVLGITQTQLSREEQSALSSQHSALDPLRRMEKLFHTSAQSIQWMPGYANVSRLNAEC